MKEKINATICGISPLLQHRFDDTQSTTDAKKQGRQYDAQTDAENALYKNEKGEVCQPSSHIENTMIKAATDFQLAGKGKKTYKDLVKGSVFIEPLLIPHKIQDWVIDKQNVVIQRSRIVRARPRLDNWELSFTINIIDERLTPSIAKQILEEAGQSRGIGDFRPRFGRFKVKKFEVVKKASRN